MLLLVIILIVLLVSLLINQTTTTPPTTPPASPLTPVADTLLTLLNSVLGLFGLNTQDNPIATLILVALSVLLGTQANMTTQQLTTLINDFILSRSDVDPTWYILVGILVIMYFLLQQPVAPTTPAVPVVPPTVPIRSSGTIPVIDEVTRTDATPINDEEEQGTVSSYAPGCFRQESRVVVVPGTGVTKTSVKTFGITDDNGTVTWDVVKQ